MIYSGATLKHASTLCASSAKRERKNKRKKERKKEKGDRKKDRKIIKYPEPHSNTPRHSLPLPPSARAVPPKKKDNKKSKIQNKLTNNTHFILIFDTIPSYV